MKHLKIFMISLACTGLLIASCKKEQADPAESNENATTQNLTPLTVTDIDEFRTYTQDRIIHYTVNHPGTQNPDNPSNPMDYVGSTHNALITHLDNNYGSETDSPLDLVVSECYPDTCADGTFESGKRVYYYILKSSMDLYGTTEGASMTNADDHADYMSDVVAFIDDNWDPLNPGHYSELEYNNLFTDHGIMEDVNSLSAIIFSELDLITDPDIKIAVIKDLESHSVISLLPEDAKQGMQCAFSIYRYSADLWGNSYPGTYNDIPDVSLAIFVDACRFIKYLPLPNQSIKEKIRDAGAASAAWSRGYRG